MHRTAGQNGDGPRVWRPEPLPGAELMRACFSGQRFAPHFHERYCLGVVCGGALGFRYRGENVVAPAGSVNLAVPGEVHDGHGAGGEGWAYRMFYLDSEVFEDICPKPPHFAPGVIEDPVLARTLHELHADLDSGSLSALEAGSRFLALLHHWVQRHAEEKPAEPRPDASPALLRARDMLQELCAEDLPLKRVAHEAGLSPWHFARSFAARFGLPPHAFQTQARVRCAAALLRSGTMPAQAALDCGFADQVHLTRWFRRFTGLTPARYRKMVQESRP